MPTTILLTFDRLQLGFLGPYGNEWIETPNWNRLASDGVTFDQCLADVHPLDDPRHAFWQSEGNWLAALQAAGVRRILVTDATAPALPEAGFDEVHKVRGVDGPDASETETTFAKLMVESGRVLARLRQSGSSALLWIRARGVPEPWLPPREFMDLYFEEFGLTPAASTEEPEEPEGPDASAEIEDAWDRYENDDELEDTLPEPAVREPVPLPEADDEGPEVLHVDGHLSDELRAVRAVYAGYVSFIDRWLAKLLTVRSQFTEPTLFIAAAVSGEDLSDQEGSAETLAAVTLHIPLVLHVPGLTDGSRRQALVQLADIPATITEWHGVMQPLIARPQFDAQSLLPVVRGLSTALRTEVRLTTDTQLGLWTEDYFYFRNRHGTPTEQQESARLYEKPHDRWDQANVAMLSHGQADDLEARLIAAGPPTADK